MQKNQSEWVSGVGGGGPYIEWVYDVGGGGPYIEWVYDVGGSGPYIEWVYDVGGGDPYIEWVYDVGSGDPYIEWVYDVGSGDPYIEWVYDVGGGGPYIEWVYDVGGSGPYIEAAINSTGITDEQLVQNVASRTHTKIKQVNTVIWPPRVDQLEEEEEICELVTKFLTWLKNPNKKSLNYSPQTVSLESLIQQYVTSMRRITSINLGVDLHGHTRSKGLVGTFHKAGICISYADILLFYDKCALEDLEASIYCPREIDDGVGTICIVDNNDFKIDTLTGQAQHAHRTNVMFVKPQSLEKKPEENVSGMMKKQKGNIWVAERKSSSTN